ncbi:uncharacterized protein At5g41620-like isoform X2 [Trifolium pratense]|uniref:uncharacterized protein At5g41620-like isoform X2 n=1 Tax=Trifolium pratense TaxID=57577 RepID=UPI001E695989|nr:uncharacterized protein At5g41620-like isoform X2 [Trifolium pratense]
MSFEKDRENKKIRVMVEKWKKGVFLVGKKGGTCSTPSPTWRSLDPSSCQQNSILSTSTISARKLCANLWQIYHTPFVEMNKCGDTTLRRRRRQLTQPPLDTPSDQVTPYKCAATPTSSLDFKGMIEESRCNITTSTEELLNVLNRIWSLEEQHASNISAMKALKMELVREKQMNMQEIEKKMTIEKFVRKDKERDRIKDVVQSLKEELEHERMLRKHYESLHRKLAKELSEVKSSFFGCLRNLERERKTRMLLENLCNEFAKGIRDYDQQVHCLRKNSRNGYVRGNSVDQLILHISEAWLDERAQMKLAQSDSNFIERTPIVEKLGFDIETFLLANRSGDFRKYGYSSPNELKETYTMDSFPLQDAASAPQDMDQEDSIDNDYFKTKEITVEGLRKLGSRLERNNATELHRGNKGSESSIRKEVMSKEITEDCHLQASIERNVSCNDNNESCFVEKKSNEMAEDNIKPWKSMLIASDFDKTESSTKLPKGVKENTLLAKLLEARLERQKTRSKGEKSVQS